MQVRQLSASERELQTKVTTLQADLAAAQTAATQEAERLQGQIDALLQEADALKMAVESSALSINRGEADRKRLHQELATVSGNMERVCLQLQQCSVSMLSTVPENS